MAPKWVLCSFGMISEFLRNPCPPKWSVFYQACECKVTTRKSGFQIFRKFVAFRNVKTSSHLQCLRGKIYFFVSQKCTNLEMSFDAKMTPLANLTIEAQNRPICTLLVTIKNDLSGQNDTRKWLFGVRKILRIRALKVVIGKKSLVICHFSKKRKQKK